jgi:1-acyl-sn-glycerol-3-phosphate acyltransferase
VKGILERWIREKGFWWYGFCQFLSIVFFLLFFRYRVFGREHVPSKGPVLIASNHQSFFDPVLVGLGLGRQIHIMAREGLFRIPGFAALIRSLNAFPLKRGAFDRDAIKQALGILESGNLLLLFPEGTRTRTGRLQSPRPGISLLARKANAPVVPAVIHGAYRAWPPHRKLFGMFRPIQVVFGRPLQWKRGRRGAFETQLAERWADLMKEGERRNP